MKNQNLPRNGQNGPVKNGPIWPGIAFTALGVLVGCFFVIQCYWAMRPVAVAKKSANSMTQPSILSEPTEIPLEKLLKMEVPSDGGVTITTSFSPNFAENPAIASATNTVGVVSNVGSR